MTAAMALALPAESRRDELLQLSALIPSIPEELLGAPDHGFVAPDLSANPFAELGKLRDAHGIVLRGDDGSYAGLKIYNVFGHDLSRPHALALSFAAVSEVAMAPQRFRSAQAYGMHEEIQGHTVNCTDGDEHRQLRGVLDTRVFGPKPMERWREEIVGPTAAFLIERLAAKLQAGEVCDFRREVALPLVYRSIAAIIGIPADGIDFFVEKGEIAQSAPRNPEAAMAAVAEMNAYFWRLFEERKAAPRNDLISAMIAAADEGRMLSDAEIVDNCRFLVPGGIETTWRQAANILYALMTHPQQYAAVVADPSVIDAAVEEGIRWMPSANIAPRLASEDTTIAGVEVPAGTGILSMIGAANRDPARWEDADRFDIFRPQKRHMTFHAGIHHCIGHILARSAFRAALSECVARVPTLRLAVDPDAVAMHGFVIRCPDGLPVTLQ